MGGDCFLNKIVAWGTQLQNELLPSYLEHNYHSEISFSLRIPWEFSLPLSCIRWPTACISPPLLSWFICSFQGAHPPAASWYRRWIFGDLTCWKCLHLTPLILDYCLVRYRILDWWYFPSEYWKHCCMSSWSWLQVRSLRPFKFLILIIEPVFPLLCL